MCRRGNCAALGVMGMEGWLGEGKGVAVGSGWRGCFFFCGKRAAVFELVPLASFSLICA